MAINATTTSSTSPSSTSQATPRGVKGLLGVHTWPPLVYFLLGVVCLTLWLAGTAVQVQTSEAWMMQTTVRATPTLSTFAQLVDFVRGLPISCGIVPFIFAWGVQLASIVASVGIEMPPHPAWRFSLSWIVVVGLIIVNSCGDFFYRSPYGTWGQIGFSVVILFVTFCLGLFAVMAFVHMFRKLFS
jgi:hypothetical protein